MDQNEANQSAEPLARHNVEPEFNDVVFQAIVASIDKTSASLLVTVSCGGLLISGQLTTRAEYMASAGQQMMEFFKRVPDHEAPTKEELQRSFDASFASVEQEMAAKESNAPAHPKDPMKMLYRYFHLKGAVVMQGGRVIAEQTWWRGRTSAVDGWRFGRMF